MLMLFRIITGLAVGGEWATGQTYLGETFPPKMRGRYSAIMQTGAPLGILLASVVGGFFTPVIISYIAIKFGLAGGISIARSSRFLQEFGFGFFRKLKGKGSKSNIQHYFSVLVPFSRSGFFGIITAGLFNASFRFSSRNFISSLSPFS